MTGALDSDRPANFITQIIDEDLAQQKYQVIKIYMETKLIVNLEISLMKKFTLEKSKNLYQRVFLNFLFYLLAKIIRISLK